MNNSIGLIGWIGPLLGVAIAIGVSGFAIWAVVVPLIRRSMERSRLMQTGMDAEATLVNVEQTGTFINNNPVCRLTLDVRVPGRPVYRATSTETIQLVSLSQMTLGKDFLVKVDPAHPEKIAIRGAKPQAATFGSAAEILATGVPGHATVLRTWDMGLVPDGSGDPVAGLEMTVQVGDGRPPYQVQLGHRIPKGVTRPAVGAVLQVRVSPQDPSRVAIDFARSQSALIG